MPFTQAPVDVSPTANPRPHRRRRPMTAETLNSYSAKDLAEMAKNRGVAGWHSMRKEQLIKALIKLARQKTNKSKAREADRNGAGPARVNGSVRPVAASRSAMPPRQV